ncbi:hypothetical protein LP420_34910 [Massilia sp. B-10]|nr:hypothetical protein LP420_34910 [Massilia sp. B-10]UUZ53695.1 hypothetical protein LP419_34365 [Massilia sp. H-1]
MHGTKQSLQSQRGVSLTSLIVGIGVIMMIGMFVMKVFPFFMEYQRSQERDPARQAHRRIPARAAAGVRARGRDQPDFHDFVQRPEYLQGQRPDRSRVRLRDQDCAVYQCQSGGALGRYHRSVGRDSGSTRNTATLIQRITRLYSSENRQ